MAERLKWIEEHFEEYIALKIIDAVVAVVVTFIVVKLFEPVLRASPVAAQAAIEAAVRRV